jgi:hypothetical protein
MLSLSKHDIAIRSPFDSRPFDYAQGASLKRHAPILRLWRFAPKFILSERSESKGSG